MKNIILLLAVCCFINCKAQTVVNINTYGGNTTRANKYFKDLDDNYSNFVGTWENTTGNITFRLILWKSSIQITEEPNSFMDRVLGTYLVIQNVGTTNEIILYNSIKYFPQNGYTSNWILSGISTIPNKLNGSFTDTNANNGAYVLDGAFRMEILNLNNIPTQAQWNLKSTGSMFAGDSYTVPTDCILTKVN